MKTTRNIDKYAKDYILHENDFESIMVEFRRKKVLEILHKFKPKSVLEIGCGMQSIFDFYFEYDKFIVVEPSSAFVKTISHSNHFNAKITIINDFLENQISRLKHEKFDFIILSSLLHEVQNPLNFLKLVRKICQKSTILHINVPNNKSFHLLWAFESGLLKLGSLTPTAKTLQQNSTFDLKSLKTIAKNAGFKVCGGGGESYFMKPFNHKKMAELINLGIIDKNLLNGLHKLSAHFPKNGAEIYINCKVKK